MRGGKDELWRNHGVCSDAPHLYDADIGGHTVAHGEEDEVANHWFRVGGERQRKEGAVLQRRQESGQCRRGPYPAPTPSLSSGDRAGTRGTCGAPGRGGAVVSV
jgi:hypothetical protein